MKKKITSCTRLVGPKTLKHTPEQNIILYTLSAIRPRPGGVIVYGHAPTIMVFLGYRAYTATVYI